MNSLRYWKLREGVAAAPQKTGAVHLNFYHPNGAVILFALLAVTFLINNTYVRWQRIFEGLSAGWRKDRFC
jgi:hypothetical protein